MLFGAAERACEAQFREVMGEQRRDVVQIRRRYRLLRLAHLDRIRDSCVKLLPSELQIIPRHLLIVLGQLDLVGCRLQVQVGVRTSLSIRARMSSISARRWSNPACACSISPRTRPPCQIGMFTVPVTV